LTTCLAPNETTPDGKQHQQSPHPSALQGTEFFFSSAVPMISAAAKVISTESNSKATCFPLALGMIFASERFIVTQCGKGVKYQWLVRRV